MEMRVCSIIDHGGRWFRRCDYSSAVRDNGNKQPRILSGRCPDDSAGDIAHVKKYEEFALNIFPNQSEPLTRNKVVLPYASESA